MHGAPVYTQGCNKLELTAILADFYRLLIKLPARNLTLSLTSVYHRLPSGLSTDSTDFMTGPFLLSISVTLSVFCFPPADY